MTPSSCAKLVVKLSVVINVPWGRIRGDLERARSIQGFTNAVWYYRTQDDCPSFGAKTPSIVALCNGYCRSELEADLIRTRPRQFVNARGVRNRFAIFAA